MSSEEATKDVKEEEVKKEEEPSTETSTPSFTEDDLKAIEEVKKRLKFFFSDANVRQDYFIRRLLTNEDGLVPIEALLRFNTIKSLTTNPALIVQATKGLADILKLNEKEEAIGRVKPFTEDMMDDNIPLTLHVGNLPMIYDDDDDKKKKGKPKNYNVKMDEVRALFEKYGEIALTKLRWSSFDKRDRERKPRIPMGYALVEFNDVASLEKAASETLTHKLKDEETCEVEAVEAKEKLTLGENTLEIMVLKDYIAKKKKIKEVYGGGGDQTPGEKEFNKGNKKRKADRPAEEETEEKPVKVFTFDWKPGCVIKLKGLPKEECDREALLDMIGSALDATIGEIKQRNIYADYSRGQEEGAIRFPEPHDDITKLQKGLKAGEFKIKDNTVEDAYILEGDDEKKYWEDFIEFKNKQMQTHAEQKRSKKQRGGGGGRNRGRGGGGRRQ